MTNSIRRCPPGSPLAYGEPQADGTKSRATSRRRARHTNTIPETTRPSSRIKAGCNACEDEPDEAYDAYVAWRS